MFHEKVTAYCSAKGITAGEFERRCGLSNGMVGKWKKTTPRIETLKKIAKATDTQVSFWLEDLVGDIDGTA